MRIIILLILLQCAVQQMFCVEISFIAIDPHTDQTIASVGPCLDQRFSPCCTFNIALSVIGYEVGILQNAHTPVWPYDGSFVPLDSHKAPQSPKTWMSLSVVWYSKLLARKIGREVLQKYVALLSYGNQDLSGDKGKEDGFASAHLVSSLKISPREQVGFLKRLIHYQLPVSSRATDLTKALLFNQSSASQWKLFGKTGTGIEADGHRTLAWYVGWIEKERETYVFALLARDVDSFLKNDERREIVRKLFLNSGIDIEK